jgi:hypothetical protein
MPRLERPTGETFTRRPQGHQPRIMGPFFMSVSTLEPVSGQVGLCFPGKVILWQRQNGNDVRGGTAEKSRDQVDPAERRQYVGIWRRPPEISGVRRLIGGAMRTRTKDPDSFIDGAR